MEDEVDSLEHIMALVHNNPMDQKRNNNYPRNNNMRNPQPPLEEPSYRLLPTSENHASSFGAGGTISQVVDPHFRQPTTTNFHTFGQMLDSATMSTNIMSSTLLDYGPPVTVSNFNNMNNNGFIMGRQVSSISPPPPPPPPPAYEEHQNHNYHQQQPFHHNLQMQPHHHNQQQQPHHHNPFLPPGSRQTNTMDSYRSSANEPFRPPYIAGGPSPQPAPQIFLPNRNQMPPIITTSAPSMRSTNIGYANSTMSNQPTQTSFTPSTSQHIRPNSSSSSSAGNFNTSSMPRTDDGPLYSPKPKNPSPPLDQINMPNTSAPNSTISSSSNNNTTSSLSGQNLRAHPNNTNSNSSPRPSTAGLGTTNLTKTTFSSNKPASVGEALGRIPKKKSEAPQVSDRYDEMSMLVLQEKFRECEARLDVNRRKRQEVEKVLNDMARNSHGKNIELDPRFREKKDDQRKCDEIAQEIRAKMKKISEKLLTKFNHKIVPKPIKTIQMAPNRQPPKRAKMSTAASTPRIDLTRDDSPQSNKDRARMMLQMSESRIWCKICDIHFESFKEYCDHLHKKDHLRNMKRSQPPWHRTKDKVDRPKTYNMIKSICARVSNDVNSDFTIAKLNKILNPVGTDEKTLKNMILERERGNFDEDDPLLHVKGYENLVPISGYFCQLCDRSYCDFTAIDQHIKSYDHNYRHAISVANDEASEKTFRELQEKSYKKQHPEEEKSSTSPVQTNSEQSSIPPVEAPSSSSSTRATNAPPAQYKKPTSHIVDEHEAVVKKFPASSHPERRPISPVVKQKSKSVISSARSKRMLQSDDSEDEQPRLLAKKPTNSPKKNSSSTKIFVKNRMPEIVPIRESNTKPSALKHLRNEKRPKPISKPYISSTESNSSSDNEVEFIDSSELATGDPDSPFPHLLLTSTGNTHLGVLKDMRLAQPCVVKMNRINIDDYKDMLMDSTTVWRRILHLFVKGEGDPRLQEVSKQLREKHITRPTYFTASGSTIPVDVDKEIAQGDKKIENADDDSEMDEKPNLSGLLNDNSKLDEQQDSKRSTQQSQKSSSTDTTITTTVTTAASTNEKDDSDVSDLDISDSGDGKDKNFGMHMLEDFFCEK